VAPVFYIYGEVRQPGAYPLAPDMTVRQALSMGGGLTVRGTERGIRLERKVKGKDDEGATRRPSLDDRLRPNDVLYVPESWF
jgi:polysaccharide export outer membrane protein